MIVFAVYPFRPDGYCGLDAFNDVRQLARAVQPAPCLRCRPDEGDRDIPNRRGQGRNTEPERAPTMSGLPVVIHQITARIRDYRDRRVRLTESDTIRVLVLPVLDALGWDLQDVEEVRSEYRHLVTNTGWKVLLDRGLDVLQRADLNNGFSPASRHQRFRQVRAFKVTYLREGVHDGLQG